MRKIIFIVIINLLIITSVKAQYKFGTNSANPNALVTFYSPDSSKGIIIPIVTNLNRPNASTTNGMIIYNQNDSCIQISNGTLWKSIGIDSLNFKNSNLYIYEGSNVADSINLTGFYPIASDSLLQDTVFTNYLNDSISGGTDSSGVIISNSSLIKGTDTLYGVTSIDTADTWTGARYYDGNKIYSRVFNGVPLSGPFDFSAIYAPNEIIQILNISLTSLNGSQTKVDKITSYNYNTSTRILSPGGTMSSGGAPPGGYSLTIYFTKQN